MAPSIGERDAHSLNHPPGVFPNYLAVAAAFILGETQWEQLAMKISSDPGMVSALETWLHDTAEADPAQTQQPASTAELPSATNTKATSSRDSAEGLLELDVWKGVPNGSRSLSGSTPFLPCATEPAGIIQAWADHIFHPLV